jgi:hypothetical protein
MKKTNRREQNQAAKAARIAAWAKNKETPEVTPSPEPSGILGRIRLRSVEPEIAIDQNSGALTPTYKGGN